MSAEPPVIFDDDNPEWTEEDFARARPLSDFPELEAAFKRARGRPRGETKQQVTVRLDTDLVEKLRAMGPGWQTRMNAELRKAVGI